MPLLKNNAKKLITLNAPHKKTATQIQWPDKFKLMPAGDAVEVPQSIADMPYTKALIATGDIIVESQQDDEPASEPQDEQDPELVVEALELGIDVKESWKNSTLKRKIAEAKKAAE